VVPVLFRLAPQEHVLLVLMHHIVSDAWSDSVMWRELSACYAGAVAGRPVELGAVAVAVRRLPRWWQRRWQAQGVYDEQLDYWERQLSGLPVWSCRWIGRGRRCSRLRVRRCGGGCRRRWRTGCGGWRVRLG